MRKIVIGVAITAVSFVIALRMIDAVWPPQDNRRPPSVITPPLAPATQTSTVIAPVMVANSAIRDALEAAAPRDRSGRRDNPRTGLLSKAEIGWTVARGPLAVTGRSDAIAVSAALKGTLRVTGQVSDRVGNLGGQIAEFAGADIGRAVQNLAGKTFDQNAELHGGVTVTARPNLTPGWRLEPNLTSQVTIADASLPISGSVFNVAKEVKPLVDRAVAESIEALQARIRNDPTIEQAMQRQWARMCRSIPLESAAEGIPDLWLELRPVRAFAAQPRFGAAAADIVLGIQGETRVLSAQTEPDCPFPAQVEIIPPVDQGRIGVGLSIDVPFTAIDRILETRIKGKSFPDDGSGAAAVTVEDASVAGAGDRLLIALKVKVRETWSIFGMGGVADVYVWGRPVLDRPNQILRLTDVTVDVDSTTALGTFGAAARAAIPYLQSALAEKAVIDLKPFAARARQSIDAAVAEFAAKDDGVRIDAAVSDPRLAGIEFDAVTLRLFVEVAGTVQVNVLALPR